MPLKSCPFPIQDANIYQSVQQKDELSSYPPRYFWLILIFFLILRKSYTCRRVAKILVSFYFLPSFPIMWTSFINVHVQQEGNDTGSVLIQLKTLLGFTSVSSNSAIF
jgi:hypothetical protein